MKHYLTLGAILAGVCSMGQTGTAGTMEPRLKITLHVHNYAHVDPDILTRAEQETTRIYREIGIETLWLDHPVTEEQKDSAPYRISEIYLNIVPRADCLSLPSNWLGVAFGVGRNRGLLYVFYERVETLYRKQIMAAARGETSRWATTEQIMGYAMAHEIGHLLGLDAHSDVGIMRADWRPIDLLNLSFGDLFFTPQQAAIIRTEVRIRQQEVVRVTELQGPN